MLLEKITICDWRCFYGEQLIEFASKTDKNVTLIHAENGVGKTSLLNALLWCFYKKTTARFEKPDDILIQALLTKNLADYQISVDSKLIDFISKKITRSYSKIREFVCTIDEISLKKKKPINMKIIKEILEEKLEKI